MAGHIFEGVTAEQYHADSFRNLGVPTLSASIAHEVVAESPWHAHRKHPKLGGHREPPTAPMERGTVLHALVLNQPLAHIEMPYDDYKTKKAQEDRDAARAAGKIPLKSRELDWYTSGASKVRVQLRDRYGIDVAKLKCEMVIGWDDEGVPCRSMLDAVDGFSINDLKFGEVAPGKITNHVIDMGWDIEGHAHTRALEEALGAHGRVTFDMFYVDIGTWHVRRHGLGGTMRELGRLRWERGRNLWRECLTSNTWPNYADAVLDAPQWALFNEGYEHGAA
jgi:hypothetical protein